MIIKLELGTLTQKKLISADKMWLKSYFGFWTCLSVSFALPTSKNHHNFCEVKFYNDLKFRGENFAITSPAISNDFSFKDVKSLEILGPCCWEISKEKQRKILIPRNQKSKLQKNYYYLGLKRVHITLPFAIKKKKCPKEQSTKHFNSLINYLYMTGL